MSKRCAKCEKTVYPLEELKCLDKIWHKACFRCWDCSMALNMKNYKGYDKKPYCNAHYPTTKYTAVAETPEMARIAANTRMQSQIHYHADFEESKSKFTVVADDPETLRIRQNTQNISSVKYHEDFEKNIRGSKIQVADDPETLRIKASTAIISQAKYKGLQDQARDMEVRRQKLPEQQHYPAPQHHQPPVHQMPQMPQIPQQPQPQAPPPQQVPQQQQQPKAPQPAPPSNGKATLSGMVYQAVYDYDAQDEDEVSFIENDLIIDCKPIDDGWMYGTIRRTGQRGMLPANYVEKYQ